MAADHFCQTQQLLDAKASGGTAGTCMHSTPFLHPSACTLNCYGGWEANHCAQTSVLAQYLPCQPEPAPVEVRLATTVPCPAGWPIGRVGPKIWVNVAHQSPTRAPGATSSGCAFGAHAHSQNRREATAGSLIVASVLLPAALRTCCRRRTTPAPSPGRPTTATARRRTAATTMRTHALLLAALLLAGASAAGEPWGELQNTTRLPVQLLGWAAEEGGCAAASHCFQLHWKLPPVGWWADGRSLPSVSRIPPLLCSCAPACFLPSLPPAAAAYSCDAATCIAPNCKCPSTAAPGGLAPSQTPMFVLITVSVLAGSGIKALLLA